MSDFPNPYLRSFRHAALTALPALAVCSDAIAGYGVYLHGYGMQSSGAGGIGYSTVQDTYPLSANPALAGELGNRFDFGLQWDKVDPSVRIHDNAAGPDEEYHSVKTNFPIPQAGVSFSLSDDLAAGFTGFVAGTGSTYSHSPLERFGSPPKAVLSLAQAGVSSVLAYQLQPRHWIGASLNISYQVLKVEGAQAFTALSESPDRVTNQGNDGSAGIGFTLGYHGRITPWLEAGASYRSKTWTQRAKQYAGLLPEQGLLELPAIYGGGFAVIPADGWKIALEYQRVMYGDEKALSNRIEQFTENNQPLGSDDGPGFGLTNQQIYKLGLLYQATPRLQLRAGYSRASLAIPASQTFFNMLAPSTAFQHYTAGATMALKPNWEISGYFARVMKNVIHGEHSIPDFAGGGEADLDLNAYSAGLALSWKFGR